MKFRVFPTKGGKIELRSAFSHILTQFHSGRFARVATKMAKPVEDDLPIFRTTYAYLKYTYQHRKKREHSYLFFVPPATLGSTTIADPWKL